MGYYAAGGYYSAGGFSFKKLIRAVGKATSFVQKQPILSSVVSLIPGATMALSGASAVAGLAHDASASSAIRSSTAGTPGMNSQAMTGYGGRRVKRSRRRYRTVRVPV